MKVEALVAYHFKIDPGLLSDDELAVFWNRLQFVRALEKIESEKT